MARPSKYNDTIIQQVIDYLDNYEMYGDVMPSIAGLADHLNVCRETIYDWSSQKEKKEFSDMLAKLLSKQERVLSNKGLSGEFNSNLTKMFLTKHGYSDRQEISGLNGGPIETSDISDMEVARRLGFLLSSPEHEESENKTTH